MAARKNARPVAEKAWKHIADRCWLCGLAIGQFLEVAHLDQDRANNSPENLAFLCPTCHRLHDVGVVSSQDVKEARDRWLTGHYEPDLDALRNRFEAEAPSGDWKKLQKGAQKRGGAKLRRKAAARRAVETRRKRANTAPDQ